LTGVPALTEQGPAQLSQQNFGDSSTPPDDSVSGALESIAVNPNSSAQVVVGTATGGVWRTINANPANPGAITWTPLTDQLPSLAIGAVAYDPADATGNTFYAGTGLWSSNFDSGGSGVGLYRTTDAGATWTLLGKDSTGVNILATHRIKALGINGLTILVGTIGGTGIGSNTQFGDVTRDYRDLGGALFRSTDGGATFSQVLPASGLPSGAVPSLVLDPNAPQTSYAAVAGAGVFRSLDGGATWTSINTGLAPAAGSSDIELAAQNIGGVTTLFAGVSAKATLNGVFSFNSGTSSWTALAAPPGGFYAGDGFAEKFQLTTDPVNAGVVYIDGEEDTGIFRYNPAGAGSWVQINHAGAQGTFPHGDSRDLKFLDNNALLESDDGGIYVLQNPTSAATSSWNSFNGNLADLEIYSVAYDSINGVLFAGTQDNGSPHQNAAGSLSWTDLAAGDGQFQAVDTTSLGGGNVFGYSLSNDFGVFKRNRFNNANVNLTPINHAITGATNTAPIVITSPNHGLQNNDGVGISDVQGVTAANGGWLITVVDANHFSLNGSNGTASGAYLGGGTWSKTNAILNASGSTGNPVILTTYTPHNLNTGDQVYIQLLTGTYASHNKSNFYVTVIDATHFSLNGTVSDGTTAAGGFFSPSNEVMLKSAIGAANLSGLNAADQAVANTGGFDQNPFVLNSVDPRRMLLGFNGLYEDADPSAANGFAGDVITNITANLPAALNGPVTALAYGGRRNGSGLSNVAFVGTTSGQLFFRGETGSAFTNVSAQLGSTTTINRIAVDPQDWRRVYVVTGNRVLFTANITDLAGNPFQVIGGGPSDNLASLTAGLGSLAPQLRSITIVGSTPVVGGLGGLYRLLPPLPGCPQPTWSKYGLGLPEVVVRDVGYDAATDTLFVGTMGRGAWTVSNASATIAVSGTLTVTGDSSSNNMVIRVDPANPLQVQVSDGLGNTQSFDKTLFSQVVFQGVGGNDLLTVDYSNGDPLPACGLSYDGGTDSSTLVISDLGAAVGHTYMLSSSAAQRDGTTLSYTRVSGVTVAGGDQSDTFNVTPSPAVAFTIHGNGPTPPVLPGDTLNVNLASITTSQLNLVQPTPSDGFAGTWTFGNGQSIGFDGIETLLPMATDVSVTKTNPATVTAGANITYNLTVTNGGPALAQNVQLTDMVPSGTTFVSESHPAGWTATAPAPGSSSGTVTESIGNLAANTSATFMIVVKARAADVNGSTIANTANVSTATPDTNTGNDSATSTAIITTAADVSVSQTGPATITAGTNLTFTITVRNNGPSDAQNVILTDTVPAGTTFVSKSQIGSGPTFTFSNNPVPGGTGQVRGRTATLPAGSSAAFLIVVKARANDLNGSTIRNTANVSSSTLDPNLANNVSTSRTKVATSAHMLVRLWGPVVVPASGNITYTITVSNQGPSDAQNVQLSDMVPSGATFVSVMQTSGPSFTTTLPSGSTGTLTESISTLSANRSATFVLVLSANTGLPVGFDIRNTAQVNSSTFDPFPAYSSATVDTYVGMAPSP
jgi:uncharacterized repeat protein (TIGR01451 family)